MAKVLFTSANAREMSIKANASRWSKWRAEKAAQLNREKLPPIPEPVPPPVPNDEYAAKTLNRVRKQIEQVSDMLEAEEDPQKLDRLASALSRLSEIERQLANRPLPGSLKPGSPSRRQQTRIEPLPDEPTSPANPTPKPNQP